MPAPTPVVVETSPALRAYFITIAPEIVERHAVTLSLSDEDPSVPCDDAIFVGEDRFYIHAIDDGRFFVAPCFHPGHDPADIAARGEAALADLEAGLPISEILPRASMPIYYGAYTETCEQAVALAIAWCSIDPTEVPRNYNLPVIKSR